LLFARVIQPDAKKASTNLQAIALLVGADDEDEDS
jgi:hypothetical protein